MARRCCSNGSGSRVEEADEFAAREGQLHSAGRLAAEFAHQIKNPLAVINNAAHLAPARLARWQNRGRPAN
jgi:nitrogen-specific signal transduction histidine kinase